MIDKSLLYEILKIQSHSHQCGAMQNFLFDYIVDKGWEIELDEMDNIYAVKGQAETYPCIVAHMDTVHSITQGGIEVASSITKPEVVFGINPSTHRLTGIGGDDKCGIYAALHCLDVLPACKVAFFVDEEIGCVGSSNAVMSFFDDCRFVIQADRRGNADFVHDICGPLSSDAFLSDVKPILKKFGFHLVKGMMTDVEALRNNDVGVSVANMSAGYFLPHSDSEYINLIDLENVCNMMLEMCETMEKVYPFHFIRQKQSAFYGPMAHKHEEYAEWWQKFNKEGNLVGVPQEAQEVEEEYMTDQYFLENGEQRTRIHELEECGAYEIDVGGGRRRNIADMTDAEWEEFENENEEWSPVNHQIQQERYF